MSIVGDAARTVIGRLAEVSQALTKGQRLEVLEWINQDLEARVVAVRQEILDEERMDDDGARAAG